MRPGLSEWWRKYGLRMLSMVVLLFRMVECESSIVAIVEWLPRMGKLMPRFLITVAL